MDEDERLAIVRKRTLARMKKKTLKERIKSFFGNKGRYVKKDSYDFLAERGDGERIRTRKEGRFSFFSPKKKESFPVFGAPPKKTLKGRVSHVKRRAKEAAGHVKGAVSHVKKHTKAHFSFAHAENLGKWGRRYHRALHILSFLIPVLILGYVIYMNILPFGYSGQLVLDVGVDGDMDYTRDIYLSDPNNALTPVQRYGKETFREVRAEKPFYLNFYAPIDITNRTKVTMDMDYESDSPVYIEYFDDGSGKTYWRRYYKPGFRPELAGYIPIASYGSETIFAKQELMEFKCRQLNFSGDCAQEWYWYRDWYFDNASDVDEWLVKNALYESVYFYNRLVAQEDYVNDDVGYVEGEWTEINTSLRGTHEFYVYLNESLNLTVWKQDLNWYDGADDVSVELWNMDGSRLICQDTIPDDGIVNQSSEATAPVVKNTFCALDQEPRTYLLKLKFVKGSNSYTDFATEKIKINTNKIITKGNLLPLKETELYTSASIGSPISFYYWHMGKNQDITIEGEYKNTISLSKENQTQIIPASISGKNTIYFPKGDLWIYSNLHFSFTESSHFEPYSIKFNQDTNPSILIYDGNYRSWIYKEDNIALMADNIKIKNIKLVFKHEPL